MNVTITPRKIKGPVTPPSSKSQSHRLIIAAALAEGTSVISNLSLSEDITATLRCMEALGAAHEGSKITGVAAMGQRRGELPLLDCCESGSTLRFLIPVALAVAGGGRFVGQGRLLARPMKPYEVLFREHGISYEATPEEITVKGELKPGTYRIPGNISSQFITGLLFALPLLEGDSDLVLTTKLESAAYVDMTLDALRQFGVAVEARPDGWHIPGHQRPKARNMAAEGDWSQAAFYYAARGLGNDVDIWGMNPDSYQGDKIIREYATKLNGAGTVTLDVSQCPDLAPALAVHAALRTGETTHIIGGARLRMKECDRIDAITTELNKLGARITQYPDSMTIEGTAGLAGGETDSHNDHRIAMMLAIAATRAEGPVLIGDAGSVAKSYPHFWEDYRKLGGEITLSDTGRR